MIRVAISVEAFEAIAATLPLGSIAFDAQVSANSGREIWLERRGFRQDVTAIGPR